MSRERYTRVKNLYLAICEVPTSERAAFLEQECDDPEIRAEVESLLDFQIGDLETAPQASALTSRTFAAGDVFADRYRIVAKIGIGGMGEVYRADDLTLGVPIAIKFLRRARSEELSALMNEVRLAREVSHPSVCRVFDVGEYDGETYLTMEYVAGENLASLLRRAGRVPSERAREIGADIAAGLAAAHAQGVLHRDLKPANVLVDESGGVHLTDFGIAIRAREAAGERGVPKGTPAYMAPEQFGLGENVSAATDLYGLGALLYELITGRAVFESEDTAELHELHRRAAPQPPIELVPELDSDLDQLILECLAKRGDDRPESASAVERRLRRSGVSERPAPQADTPIARSERRQITVVALAWKAQRGLDPEDMAPRLHERQRAAQAALEAEGGTLAHRDSYGMIAYFGFPTAYEDAVERALRAALAVRDVKSPEDAQAGAVLRAKIGIDTGEVVLQPGSEMPAFGDAPQLALQLRELARADDAILLTGSTERLARGRFSMEPLDDRAGADAPLFVLVGHVAGQGRRLASERLTPMVGREQEIGVLLERFQAAREGRGQVVLVSGEAGIGKSRLLVEFRDRLAGGPHQWVEGLATPETQGTALYPAIELIERSFGGRSRGERIELLAETLAPLDTDLGEAVPLLADLLSLPDHARYPSKELAPQLKRQRTIEFLVAWVLALSERDPLVFVLEDLHWADPSTLEVLALLIEQAATAPLMIILTTRPEFQPTWPPRSNQTPVSLGPLSGEQAREIALRATHGEVTPEDATAIATRADGNPFFVEELARSLDEGITPTGTVPDTLRDLLAARLGRLGAHRGLAQLGAVIGRDFDYSLVAALQNEDEEALQNGLAALVRAEVLHQRGQPPRARYRFQHALLRDAAYHSLVRGERSRLHAVTATVLRENFPELTQRQPELVGHHLEGAGRGAEAASAFLDAGAHAAERWAFAEAEAHLRHGLDLLESDSLDARELESALLSRLSATLFATQGYASRDALEALNRARSLVEGLGPSTELFQVLFGIWVITYSLGHREATESLCDKLLALAEALGGTQVQSRAKAAAAFVASLRGNFAEAEAQLSESVQLRAFRETEPEKLYLDEDIWLETWVRCIAPLYRGKLDAAERAARELLTAVDERGAPFARAYAAGAAGIVYYEIGKLERGADLLAQGAEIGRTHGLATEIAIDSTLCGAMRAELGGGADAVALMEDGFTRWDETLGSFGRPYAFALAARGLAASGDLDGGLEAVERGIALAQTNLDSYYAPELRRIRGELLLRRDGDRTSAEADLRASLDMARTQGAALFELRSARDLARLLFDAGKGQAARELLEPVVDAFPSARGVDWDSAQALLREIT